MQQPAPTRRFIHNAPGRRPIERLEARTLFAAVSWDAGGDGQHWHDPLNWSPDGVPSADDHASITRAGTYSVQVTGAPAVAARLTLGGPSGRQTLLLNAALTLGAGASAVGPNGTLRVPSMLSGGDAVFIDNRGSIQLEGATVSLQLRNAGLVLARGQSTFTAAASLDNTLSGRVRVEADDVHGDATLTLSGGLVNHGTVELTSTASTPRDVTLDTGGPLTNLATGVVDILPADAPEASGRRVLTAALVNEGELRVNHDTLLDEPSAIHAIPGRITLFGGNLTVAREGSTMPFTVAGGTIDVGAGRELRFTGEGAGAVLALQRGTLRGSGTVRASVVNNGVVDPGPAGAAGRIGTLSVAGSYLQGPQGQLHLDLGFSGLDKLTAGASALDGTLVLRSPAGIEAPAGSSFEALTATSRVGAFATVVATAGEKQLAPSYFPGGVRAVVVRGDAPPAPDLAPESDSGFSDADDITRDNTPRLAGSAEDGATVVVLADGVEIGSAVAGGGRWAVDVATADALADGTHALTAHLVDAQGDRGPGSAPLVVAIDTAAPRVVSADFRFAVAPHQVVMTFGEELASTAEREGLAVERLGSELPAFHPERVSYDAGTRTATFAFGGRLPDGSYRATLSADAVADVAGNTLAANADVDFFVLTGDVNRDRAVNGSDFALLAAHFGRSGVGYGQGDGDGDGDVDGSDFALLAGNFGRTMAPPPAASVSPPPPGREAGPGTPAAHSARRRRAGAARAAAGRALLGPLTRRRRPGGGETIRSIGR